MTTRLPDEPMRVTSWLAGWVDYVFAMVLVAGRWLRLPVAPADREPAFRTAFAPTMHESFDPHWGSDDGEQRSGPLVKVAEIVMLSISFFLAAHLLSGGASTAVAPNLNRLLGSTAQAQAQGQLVASTPRLEITVPPSVYAGVIPAATVEAPPAEQATVLEPPAATGPEAASVQQAEPAPAPTQAPAAVAPAPQPTPPPAAIAPPPAPAVTAPTPVGRYLSSDEVRAAAIAAGWPANLVEDAVNVAWCESRFHNGAEYGGALGLMQMMPFWFSEAGLNPDQWSDPVVNLKAALFAFREHERNHADPWGPWTCKPDHGLAQPD